MEFTVEFTSVPPASDPRLQDGRRVLDALSTAAFERLSVDVDPLLAVTLDGVRFAIEMAKLSYVRLQVAIGVLSTHAPSHPDHRSATYAALEDAWSVLDTFCRLAHLVKAHKTLRSSDAGKRIGLLWKDVKVARDWVHHLHDRGRMDALAATGRHVWGALGWQVMQGDGQVRLGFVVAGSARRKGIIDPPLPSFTGLHSPFGALKLTGYERLDGPAASGAMRPVAVPLSELIDAIADLVPVVRDLAATAIDGSPDGETSTGADAESAGGGHTEH